MGKKKNKNGGQKIDDDHQTNNNNNYDNYNYNYNYDNYYYNNYYYNNTNTNTNTTNGDGEKEEEDPPVVLKIDLHCDGCATRINKLIRAFKGVEYVKVGDGGQSNKLTVVGKVDPTMLCNMLRKKTKKKVELVSPLPKKDKDGGGGGGDKKAGDKSEKSKEPPETTAVMKLNLHCQGCVTDVRKIVTETKGYQKMAVDQEKGLVTVTGTMDMKALAEKLQKKLKKPVEIVPPKKEGGEKKDKGGGGGGGGGEKKEKGGGGGGSEKKEKGGGGGDGESNNCGANKAGEGGGRKQAEEKRIQNAQQGNPNPNNGSGWGYPIEQYHPPQMFSDENPNAFCVVM